MAPIVHSSPDAVVYENAACLAAGGFRSARRGDPCSDKTEASILGSMQAAGALQWRKTSEHVRTWLTWCIYIGCRIDSHRTGRRLAGPAVTELPSARYRGEGASFSLVAWYAGETAAPRAEISSCVWSTGSSSRTYSTEGLLSGASKACCSSLWLTTASEPLGFGSIRSVRAHESRRFSGDVDGEHAGPESGAVSTNVCLAGVGGVGALVECDFLCPVADP